VNQRGGLGLGAAQQRERRLVPARDFGQLDRLIDGVVGDRLLQRRGNLIRADEGAGRRLWSAVARPRTSAIVVSMAPIIS